MDNRALIIVGSRTNITVDKPDGLWLDDGDSDDNSLDRLAYTYHGTAIVPAKRFRFMLARTAFFFKKSSYFVHSCAVVFGTFLIIPISSSSEGAREREHRRARVHDRED